VFISNTEQNLQFLCDKLSLWCQKWEMKVNISKCGTIRFKPYPKTNIYPPLKIIYNGQIIDNVQTYTYLGVVFDDIIETNSMINDRIKKGIIQYKKYENFLRSNKISLIAKSWCLKLVILPSLT
jgi:hypothetical protein